MSIEGEITKLRKRVEELELSGSKADIVYAALSAKIGMAEHEVKIDVSGQNEVLVAQALKRIKKELEDR